MSNLPDYNENDDANSDLSQQVPQNSRKLRLVGILIFLGFIFAMSFFIQPTHVSSSEENDTGQQNRNLPFRKKTGDNYTSSNYTSSNCEKQNESNSPMANKVKIETGQENLAELCSSINAEQERTLEYPNIEGAIEVSHGNQRDNQAEDFAIKEMASHLILHGIVTGNRAIAHINDSFVQVNELIEGFVLKEVKAEYVVLERDGKNIKLAIKHVDKEPHGDTTKQCSTERQDEIDSYLQRLPQDSWETAKQSIEKSGELMGEILESQIDDQFEGWVGETVVELRNKQLWQQDADCYIKHSDYMPKVLIYRTKQGRSKMLVNGLSDAVYVKQLSIVLESQIDRYFEGWDGGTLFRLTNGQFWQQTSDVYTDRNATRPKIFIYKISEDIYRMKVHHLDDTTEVRCVGNIIESQIVSYREGLDGDIIIELSNGQVWIQTDEFYTDYCATNPEVLVYKNKSGLYEMKLVKRDVTIPVRRAK
jgi:hypothetical protein